MTPLARVQTRYTVIAGDVIPFPAKKNDVSFD